MILKKDFTFRYVRYAFRNYKLDEMQVLDISNMLYEYYHKPFAYTQEDRIAILSYVYHHILVFNTVGVGYDYED